MKMVQKKLTKSVTKKLITQIIQESTDAIYKFEDDSISIADHLLKEVLNSELHNIANEAIHEEQYYNKSNADQDVSMDFALDDMPANVSDEELGDHDIVDEGFADIEVPNEHVVHSAQINERDRLGDTREAGVRRDYSDSGCDITNESFTGGGTGRVRGTNMMQETNRSYSIISMNES